jgi:hypothetical protein
VQIFKAIGLPVIGISIIIFTVYIWAWRQPKCVTEVEDADTVGNLQTDFNLINSNSKLVFFDVSGSINSGDYSIKQLEEKWQGGQPDLLLVDGKTGFFLPGLMDPVKKFGLTGKALELALKNKVAVYSYNLPDEKIVEELLKKYPPRQIALSFVLSSYFRNSKCSKNISRENVLRDCIYNNRYTVQSTALNSAKDIDRIWERDFPNSKSWRDSNYLPGYTGAIEMEISKIKQRHYYNLISHFLKQNRKIFVVGTPYPVPEAEVKR